MRKITGKSLVFAVALSCLSGCGLMVDDRKFDRRVDGGGPGSDTSSSTAESDLGASDRDNTDRDTSSDLNTPDTLDTSTRVESDTDSDRDSDSSIDTDSDGRPDTDFDSTIDTGSTPTTDTMQITDSESSDDTGSVVDTASGVDSESVSETTSDSGMDTDTVIPATPCSTENVVQICGPGGHCVDGYCCNSACTDDCGACNIQGREGFCSPLPAMTLCRESAGECDVAERCDGSHTVCPIDSFADAKSPCGNDADSICDRPDSCDSAGHCLQNLASAETICREMNGDCDAAEYCDGKGTCPADMNAKDNSPCGGVTVEYRCSTNYCDAVPQQKPRNTCQSGFCTESSWQKLDTCSENQVCYASASEAECVPCDQPPANTCETTTSLMFHIQPGFCNDTGGRAACDYIAEIHTCAGNGNDCQSGRCCDSAWGYYDPQTGLCWEDPPPAAQMTLSDAEQYCDELALGGYADWRLPTVQEMISLQRGCVDGVPTYDFSRSNCPIADPGCYQRECRDNPACGECPWQEEAPRADGCYWPEDMEGDCTYWYWSSTRLTGDDSNQLWEVSFGGANIEVNTINGMRQLRCARGPAYRP